MRKLAVVEAVERRRSSVNGNPRWLVQLDDGTSYLTATDAAVNYGIQNSELSKPNQVEVTVENGRIVYIEPAVVEHRQQARTNQQNAARRLARKKD